MTLQASGQISLGNVNTELGLTATAQISLNDSAVRTLAGVSSGPISLSQLYGKSNITDMALTITSNQTNLNVATYASANGWTSDKRLTLTINSGVYILASSTGNYAMTVTASFPSGLTIINNGAIVGAGGAGGAGAPWDGWAAGGGGGGGPAIYAGQTFSLVNNGYVAGGGGGGGGGRGGWVEFSV